MSGKAILDVVTQVTKDWTRQRKAEEREASRRLRRAEATSQTRETNIIDAAAMVMERAYLKASANGTLPAAARQIFYAARPLIQEMTGRELKSKYFTQTLLPNFMIAHPDLTKNWDVVFDARGHLTEPHTRKVVPLGTLDVRRYLATTTTRKGRPALNVDEAVSPQLAMSYPTSGPTHRYGAILFIEKEGFMPLFDKVSLGDRYDIAIMSTKGMSVVAARLLVDQLCQETGITLFILRDFDKSGFSIAGTLQRSGRRYKFKNVTKVIDLGLRLDDVKKWGLESEEVVYKSNPTLNLRENGAADEEIAFLYEGHDWSGHHGRRVELNAFMSDQLIEWIEGKLNKNGVAKIVPDVDTLTAAYRRVVARAEIQRAISKANKAAWDKANALEPPADLAEQILERIEGTALSWDDALSELVRDDRDDDDQGERESGDELPR